MKRAGWILIVISAAVIFYNVIILSDQNERLAKERPLETLVSLGTNLKPAYSFTAPYDPFEIFIFVLGVGGVVMIVVGNSQNRTE
jgi:hypothetical protein